MKKYIAETIGTYTLTLIVLLSVAGVSVGMTAGLAAITLGVFVYTIGPVSGSHINPAVTFALWVMGKVKFEEGLNYIVAQLAGALLALGTAWVSVDRLSARIADIQNRVGMDWYAGLGELLGAAIFGFGIMAVVSGKVKNELSGAVIGGSLFLGLMVAGSVSNGILNPAVAVALGSIDVMHVFGPLIGMVLGMRLYAYLTSGKRSRV